MPLTEYGNWSPGEAWEDGYFWPNDRSIGGILAQVTIEETERDDLTVTEHPIEQGAPIADHAFKRPSEVVIRAGWNTAHAIDLSAASGIYGLLLSWQASLKPFNLYTGKRVYRDMLMTSLVVTTDQTTEYALMATITCKQVILVSTTEAVVTAVSSNPDNHESQKTAPTQDGGNKTGTPASPAESTAVIDANIPT